MSRGRKRAKISLPDVTWHNVASNGMVSRSDARVAWKNVAQRSIAQRKRITLPTRIYLRFYCLIPNSWHGGDHCRQPAMQTTSGRQYLWPSFYLSAPNYVQRHGRIALHRQPTALKTNFCIFIAFQKYYSSKFIGAFSFTLSNNNCVTGIIIYVNSNHIYRLIYITKRNNKFHLRVRISSTKCWIIFLYPRT